MLKVIAFFYSSSNPKSIEKESFEMKKTESTKSKYIEFNIHQMKFLFNNLNVNPRFCKKLMLFDYVLTVYLFVYIQICMIYPQITFLCTFNLRKKK